MNDMTHSAPAWAVTHTEFPAGEYDAEAVTRWEGEPLAAEVETVPAPRQERPSIIRAVTEAIDNGPAEVVLDLYEVHSENQDEYRLTLDGLDQFIVHLTGYRDRLRAAVRPDEARS